MRNFDCHASNEILVCKFECQRNEEWHTFCLTNVNWFSCHNSRLHKEQHWCDIVSTGQTLCAKLRSLAKSMSENFPNGDFADFKAS